MKTSFGLILLVLITAAVSSCRTNTTVSNDDGALTVSAAVSLKDAFNEIGSLHKIKSRRDIVFNFGASGTLQRQIELGAPADVFASASEIQMDELSAKNLIDLSTRRDFARNRLTLITSSDTELKITTLADLADKEIRKIAVGNPKTVPAGQYTDQVLKHLNLKNVLSAKLILAEDVRQVLDYVARGETDVGIVYQTDAQIAGEKVRVAVNIDEETHDPIRYPIAVVKGSQHKQAAVEFTNLILSAEGKEILRKYGFAIEE